MFSLYRTKLTIRSCCFVVSSFLSWLPHVIELNKQQFPYQQVPKASVFQVRWSWILWEEKRKSPRKRLLKLILSAELPFLRVMPITCGNCYPGLESIKMNFRNVLPFLGSLRKESEMMCLNAVWRRVKLQSMLVILSLTAGHEVLLIFAMKTSKDVSVHYSGSKILACDNTTASKC